MSIGKLKTAGELNAQFIKGIGNPEFKQKVSAALSAYAEAAAHQVSSEIDHAIGQREMPYPGVKGVYDPTIGRDRYHKFARLVDVSKVTAAAPGVRDLQADKQIDFQKMANQAVKARLEELGFEVVAQPRKGSEVVVRNSEFVERATQELPRLQRLFLNLDSTKKHKHEPFM